MTSNEKKVEHQESKGIDNQAVAGAQITKPEDSAIKQRQDLINGSKAHRITVGSNPLTIDMPDGSKVQDKRAQQSDSGDARGLQQQIAALTESVMKMPSDAVPVPLPAPDRFQPSDEKFKPMPLVDVSKVTVNSEMTIDKQGHIVTTETHLDGSTHATKESIGKDGKLHQVETEDTDRKGNSTVDKYDSKTGKLKEEIKDDGLTKTDTKFGRNGQAESQDTYNRVTGEKVHVDYRRNPDGDVHPLPPHLPEFPPYLPDGKSQFIDGRAPISEMTTDKGGKPDERGMESMVRPHPADRQFDEKDGLWHDKKTNGVVQPPEAKEYAIGALYNADNMNYVAWSLEHGRGATQNERGIESALRPDPPDRRFDEKDSLWHDKKSGEVVPPPRPEAYGAMGALYNADAINYDAYKVHHGIEKPAKAERGIDEAMRPHPADRHFDEKEGLWHDNKSNQVVEPPSVESYHALASLHTNDQLKYVAYVLDKAKQSNQTERPIQHDHMVPHADITMPHAGTMVRHADTTVPHADTMVRRPENMLLQRETPEVDYTKPGAPVGRWGEVSDEFYNRVNRAYDSLPETDKEILRKAGVSIVTRPELSGESGTPAEYVPEENRVYVGMKGKGSSAGGVQLSAENSDPEGSMKHEIGHAMYQALHAEKWSGFQDALAHETERIPPADKERLAHLLSSPTEMFAELYAMMRGRHTSRTDLVQKYFPKTYAQMVEQFPHAN